MASLVTTGALSTILGIQSSFAELVKRHFDDLWQTYSIGKSSKEKTIAEFISTLPKFLIRRNSRTYTVLFQRIENLLCDFDTFWSNNADNLKKAISQCEYLGVLVGDIDAVSDYYTDGILKLGLYFDTIYLLEPLSVSVQRIKKESILLSGEQFIFTVFRTLIAFLNVRGLVEHLRFDKNIPEAIFVPIVGMQWGDTVFDRIYQVATNHTNIVLSEIFDEEIKRPSDLIERTPKLSIQDFETKLRANSLGQSLLRPYTTLEDFILSNRVQHSNKEDNTLQHYYGNNAGKIYIYPHIQAEMLSLESAEVFATNLEVDAAIMPDKHQFNLHRVKNNQECGHRIGLRESDVAAHALLSKDLNWIQPESFEQLNYCRDHSVFENVRELFRTSRHNLQKNDPKSRQRAADEMIQTLFDRIEKDLQELNDNRNRGLLNLPLNIMKLGLSVSLGVLTTVFNLPLAVSMSINALVPTLTIPDILKDERKSFEREQALLKRPAFMLLNVAQGKMLDKNKPLSPDGRLPSEVFFESAHF